MNTPAKTTKLHWTETEGTGRLSKVEICKNVVRLWYKQLKDKCSGCTGDVTKLDGNDDDGVIELIDRLMSTTDNPIYTRITGDTIKELSLTKFQITGDNADDEGNELTNPIFRPDHDVDREQPSDGANNKRLTFESVWTDLVHLRSTREFCLYLKNNAQLTRPEFLVQIGLFGDDREYAKALDLWRKNTAKTKP